MPQIDKIRPIYHSSGSLEEQLGQLGMESPPLEKGKKKDGEIRRFPEEEDEDILKESNSRFVLFPIRYREVSDTRRVDPDQLIQSSCDRYGRRTRLHRQASGQQKSLILDMMLRIGKNV